MAGRQAKAQSGAATGDAKTYTARRTVGITDANAPMIFEDVTSRTALKQFVEVGGDNAKNYILECTSGAVAILDYDNDGEPEIFLLNGGTIKGLEGKEKMPWSALYHNLGTWEFENGTEKAGVADERWGMGVTVGDYNNDGLVEFYITKLTDDSNTLYRADGDADFTDSTYQAGQGEPTIPFLE